MRIAVFGTGGAGAFFGAKLAEFGEDVTFIARGEHLRAIRENGLRLDTDKGLILIQPAKATDQPSDVGPVDVVLLGLKAWQVAEAADAVRPLLGSNTCIVPLQNGVETPDVLAAKLGKDHVVGGLCGTFSKVAGPGVIKTIAHDGAFIKFGELDRTHSERTQQLALAFARAGVNVEIPPDIQVAMWDKLLLIASFGGVGAITRSPVGVFRSVPESRRLLESCMTEVFNVARAKGVVLADDRVAKTIAYIDTLPPSGTTSMQRDIAESRPSELDAWNGAVVRLSREFGTTAPTHEFIYNSLLPWELRARGKLPFPADFK